jgi:hypothetical protein
MRLFFFLPILLSTLSLYSASSSASIATWPPIKGRLALLKYEDRFAITDGMYEKAIRPELISKSVRSMNDDKLSALLDSGSAYIKIGQCTDGEFTLDVVPRTYGGGIGGAIGGYATGEIVGKWAAMAAGYVILYGTQGVIRVTAGKEASDAFHQHIVEVSIPHLHEASETVARVIGLAGGVAGGVSIPG